MVMVSLIVVETLTKTHTLILECAHTHTRTHAHVWWSENNLGESVSCLLHYVGSGDQTWGQAPIPAEPIAGPCNVLFFFFKGIYN